MDGICTLANDRVYDQLIALLNSIEAHLGPEFPVCIFPYDDRTERIAEAIAQRSQVQLFQDHDAIALWDDFVRQVWDAHPNARDRWSQVSADRYYRFGTHRRFGAFSGPFERFLYMDADTLLLGPVAPIFERLGPVGAQTGLAQTGSAQTGSDPVDWVVHDFQHRDLTHVYEVASPRLPRLFSPEQLGNCVFCSGFYATRRDIFGESERIRLLEYLRSGDAEILYPMAPDQTVLNYLVMRSNLRVYNAALHPPTTGTCVTSSHFEVGLQGKDYCLYDQGHPLTYLHYIGLSSQLFAQVCAGKNIQFPYRDLFLYYRYRHAPDQGPILQGKAIAHDQPSSWSERIKQLVSLGKTHNIIGYPLKAGQI